MNAKLFLKSFWPIAENVSLREKAFSGLAGLIAIGLVLAISDRFLAVADVPLVVASMGASAVLLFGVPSGPLSQPWPLVGGHLISGVVGVSCAHWIAGPVLAGALAVAGSIFAMYLARCLHPPGGATALAAVVGGDQLHQLGYQFLVMPLALNLTVMLAAALLLNNLLPRRCYPAALHSLRHRSHADTHAPPKRAEIVFDKGDLSTAMQELGFYVDVSEDDLSRIYNHTLAAVQRKHFGEMLCNEIMTTEVITVEYATPAHDVWALMGRHGIRGMPVVDRKGFVLGIIAVADFLKHAGDLPGDSWSTRLRAFLRPTRTEHTDKPEFAGHLMSKPPITVFEDQHVLDLVSLFYQKGVHHVPVIDRSRRLAGIVTPKHLVYALHADLRFAGERQDTAVSQSAMIG
jgi:CBS domain-containing membrane protein